MVWLHFELREFCVKRYVLFEIKIKIRHFKFKHFEFECTKIKSDVLQLVPGAGCHNNLQRSPHAQSPDDHGQGMTPSLTPQFPRVSFLTFRLFSICSCLGSCPPPPTKRRTSPSAIWVQVRCGWRLQQVHLRQGRDSGRVWQCSGKLQGMTSYV